MFHVQTNTNSSKKIGYCKNRLFKNNGTHFYPLLYTYTASGLMNANLKNIYHVIPSVVKKILLQTNIIKHYNSKLLYAHENV